MAPEIDSFVPHISFGCSNLLGDKTAQKGLALLHAAYEAGIRSFDVARVYNFGDAERLVGQFSAERRSELRITTKFGLTPNPAVAKLGGVVSLARRVMRSSSFIRKLVRRNVKNITQGGRFDVPAASASLDESLRALKTDHIDVLLLHEANASDCTDELFTFLEQARDQGKVLAFGVGSSYSRISQIVQAVPHFLQVAQFDSSPANHHRMDFDAIRPVENKLVITHGSFSGTESVRAAIAAASPEVRQWSDYIGFDLTAPGLFHAALLRCCVRSNPEGKVIFRASTARRIAENMRALDTAFTEQQLDALELLCLDRSQAAKSLSRAPASIR